MPFNAEVSATGVSEAAQANDNSQDVNQATPEKRERRSRDRYGRDRRERHANNDNATEENASNDIVNSESPSADAVPAPRSYFERGNAQSSAEAVATTQATATPVSNATAPVEAHAGLPKVQKYELPIGSLMLVAESSGLQWVNSDPEKIAQVQAAIAAEPKPVHVPRERPPAVVFDEGPLILVETRKDLSDMKLPF
jgi:ribonuclease E